MGERARCHQCHPSAGSHRLRITQQGSPSFWLFLLFPGPHGREEGREGDKLVAWPLSHLLLAVFQDLQIHLSSPTSTPQTGPLLTYWNKSLLPSVSPKVKEGTKPEVSTDPSPMPLRVLREDE